MASYGPSNGATLTARRCIARAERAIVAPLFALLVCSCGGGGSSSTSTPEPPGANSAPTADAGNSRSVFVGETVTLDGGGSSDPDGDNLRYSWSLAFAPHASKAALSNTSSQKVTFTIDQPGTYAANLTVDDGHGGTATNSVSITTVAQGRFLDGPVAGVEFTAGDRSGITDANGTFTYPIGYQVQFRIGDIVLGSAPGKSVVTVLDLAPGTDTNSQNVVTNVARLLQTLDDDGNLSNGIQISAAVRQAATGVSLGFGQNPQVFAADTNVSTAVASLSAKTQAGVRSLVAAGEALRHLNGTLLETLGGKYTGYIVGDDSGTWSIDITSNGTVAGVGTSKAIGDFSVSGSATPTGRLDMIWSSASSTLAANATIANNNDVSGLVSAANSGAAIIGGAKQLASNTTNQGTCEGPSEYASITPLGVACDLDLTAAFLLSTKPVVNLKFREKLVPSTVHDTCNFISSVGVSDDFTPPWTDGNIVYSWNSSLWGFSGNCKFTATVEDQWAFDPAKYSAKEIEERQNACGGTASFDQTVKYPNRQFKTFAKKFNEHTLKDNILHSCKTTDNPKAGVCIDADLRPTLTATPTVLEFVRSQQSTKQASASFKWTKPFTCRSPKVDTSNVNSFEVVSEIQRYLWSDVGIYFSIKSIPYSGKNDNIGFIKITIPGTDVEQKITLIQHPDPTFIQGPIPTSFQYLMKRGLGLDTSLSSKIIVPANGALVRADIPVFGLALGKQFKAYRLEFGEGDSPTQWFTLTTSNQPQAKEVSLAELYESADISIKGNLGNWDTGLKEYVYLPSYPKDHPTDLRGTHTLRLVVEGLDGTTVEDRVTVHVANVIPNAWGAKVTSQDGRFTLTVPEQALMDSFRLVLAQPADAKVIGIPPGKQLIGRVYEVREPGERFTKDVTLDMAFEVADLAGAEPGRVAIHGYNADSKRWEQLSSVQRRDGRALKATLRTLHAYYALLGSDSLVALTPTEPAEPDPARRLAALRSKDGPYLVRNDFERDVGQWSNRDHEVGGTVSLDATATFDGTKALKITNALGGGNFAVNVFTEPFDAREFPLVQFDYRIAAGVKTNFLVKVEGRWYEVRFTGDPRDLNGKRVNIAGIGDIEGVVSDDRWHTASFNLYDMLRTRTRHTIIEEMIMANWDVNGYMKLNFGKNAKGASYYIDNFAIRREAVAGLQVRDGHLLIDDFNQMKSTNALGGATTTFSSAAPEQVKTAFTPRNENAPGHALRIDYDLMGQGSYAGYVSALPRVDLRDYQALTFRISRSAADADLLVGLRDRAGHESKVRLSEYLLRRSTADWQAVSIPVAAFAAIRDWSGIENLSLSFAHDVHARGSVQIDDLAFERQLTNVAIDDFERADGMNSLGRERWTFASGAAAINGQVVHNSPNGVYRMAYGGNIGAKDAVTGELKSFAGWAASLGGIDCTRCGALKFRLRGAEGGEELTVYLSDGNFRWGVPLTKDAAATADWRQVSIPVQSFAEYGVDLTHVDELQIAFEGRETSKGERTSGTIYVDDIRFGPSEEH